MKFLILLNFRAPLSAFALLACLYLLFTPTMVVSQSCNQIEILFQESDCVDRKDLRGDPNIEDPCKRIIVCEGQIYNYTSSVTGPGWTYNWTVTGPVSVVINPNNTAASVNISWPQQGNFVLTLTATDGSGNTFTYCLKVSVKEKPVANFTFSPNNVCAGSTISFTNTTTYGSGAVSYSWNFGDPTSSNNSSSTQNPTHLYSTSGTFPVSLITCSFKIDSSAQGHMSSSVNTCCCDTLTKPVTILPGMLSIECISTVCAGDTATYTAVGCVTPTWLAPIGGTILSTSGNSITIVWGNGNPQGQIQAQCSGGCIASVPVPIIPTNPIISGNLNPCYPSSSTYSLPLLPGTFYTWTLLNTATSTFYNNLLNTFPDNNTVYINWGLAPSGSYQLSVHLDNKHLCCKSSGSILITPLFKWTAYQDKTICENDPSFLSAWPNPGGAIYNWLVLPVNIGVTPISGGGNTFNPIFSISGNYVVQVNETSVGNFCNSGPLNTQFINIKVIDKPTPGNIIGPATVCVGSTNYLYNISTNAPPGYHYKWSISGGCGTFQPGALASTTGNVVSINWTSLPCTISVLLQKNGVPQCPSSAITLLVTQANIGNILGNNIVCADAITSYNLSGTLPAGETFNWSISPPGAGTIITGPPNVMIQWHGNGNSATINVISNCGNTSLPISINLPTTGTITQTGTDFCTGVSLTASGGTGPYNWFVNGSSISGSNNTITITQGGSYAVTYTNANGCKVSATINVPIGNPCQLLITTPGPTVYCIGDPINTPLLASFGPGCAGYTYLWYLNSVSTGVTTQTYTATSAGSYYVVATKGSCVITSPTIFISQITCSSPSCVCNPQTGTYSYNQIPFCNPVNFTTTYSGVTWYYGDGYSNSAPNVTHQYASPGYYQATLLVPCLNTPCVEVFKIDSIFIPIAPDFNFNTNCVTTNFNDLTQVFVGNGGSITAWSWDFGDPASGGNNTSNLQNPVHIFTGPNIYTVTLNVTYTDGSLTCTSFITHHVIITAPISPPISINPSPVCTNVPSTFSTTLTNMLTYTWNFGDGFYGYQPSVQHSYSATGTYSVILTVSDLNGCTAINIASVNVLPGIDSCKILPANFCPGGSATILGPNITGATYSWQILSGSTFIAAPGINNTINYTANAAGFYQVVVTAPNGCSCTSNRVEIKVLPKPKAIILASPSTHLCGSENLTLYSINHLLGYTSTWYANGNYSTPVSTNQNYFLGVLPSTTVFNLILTNEYGCSDTCSLTIYINPIPPAPIIVASPSNCEGVPITLSVTNYTNNISWNTGQITTSIIVYDAGVYTATYTDPVTGCKNSADHIINRRPALELFPHFCDTIPCTCRNLDGSFTIYAPKPLIGEFATNYNIQWYAKPSWTSIGTGASYTPAQSGSYCIIATDPFTGCIDTSDTYTIVVPKCDTCECGKYEFLYSIGRGPLLPKNCGDTLLVPSSGSLLPIRFFSSFMCVGADCPDSTLVDWILTGPSPFTPISMSGVTANPGFTIPITNATFAYQGIYTLTVTGYCNGKKCPPCILYFNADGRECCTNFIDFCAAVMNAVTVSVDPKKCKATLNIGNLPKCDSLVSINWGEGPIDPGPFTAGSMPMHTYSGSGTYIISWLVLEWDNPGGSVPKICFEKVFTDTIRIRCDSCVCSISEISLEHNGLAYLLGCNNKNLTVLGCPATDIVISGFFGCVGDSCVETVVSYELQTPSLFIPGFTTNYPQLTFPANLVSEPGMYCLTLTTSCPGSTRLCECKVCWIQPECDTCCKSYEQFCNTVSNAVSISTDPKLCKATVNIGNLPNCNTIGPIYWGDGSQSSGPFTAGSMAMHTYSGSGTYIISWLALEYDLSGPPPKICFEKVFRDTIILKCDSCECNGFKPLSFSNSNWPGIELPVTCGKSYQLPCLKPGQNPLFYFHGNLNCTPDSCVGDSVTWQIVAMPLGNIVAGGSSPLYPLLGGGHFDITLNQNSFTLNVVYMLTVTGHCGSKVCTCKINFRVAPCPCPCDSLLADVKKGFSVSGNKLSCTRKFKPLGLCPQDKVTWSISPSSGLSFIPNPTTANGIATVTFNPPGGIYYVCMSVMRINPITGKPCPTKEYCQKIIVKCKKNPGDPTRYFNTCQSTLIENGDFDTGVEVGQLDLNGKVANWNLFPNSGEGFVFVEDSTGAYDDGHIILVGGKDNFACVYQKLNSSAIQLDSFTIIDFAVRNYSGDEIPEGTVLEFRLQESLDLNSPKEIIGTQKIDNSFSAWASKSISKKATRTNDNLKYLVISVQNNNSERKSAIGIDNIEMCTSSSDITNSNTPIDQVNIRIYPNPAEETFIIDLNQGAQSNTHFRISELTGRSVLELKVNEGSQIHQVDVSKLASGFYLLQVITNGKVIAVEKLMKL